MYDNNFNSEFFLIDISLTTALVLINIKALEKASIFKTNLGADSIKSIFYTTVYATGLKSFNQYLKTDNIANFADFTVDTIVILPQVLNIWQFDNKILSYGAFFGVVVGFLPQYLAKTSSDIAKYITDRSENNTSICNEYESSYFHTTFNAVIPAFARGVTYFKLKQITSNEPFSALLASSLMTLMLDRSETYTSMGINIAISSMNAAANKIEFLKFGSPLDKIYPDSSTMIAIEFIEYFLRSAQIEKLIEREHAENLNTEKMTRLIPIYNTNNDIICNEF